MMHVHALPRHAPGMRGMTLASTTRRPDTPLTDRSEELTTAPGSLGTPILRSVKAV